MPNSKKKDQLSKTTSGQYIDDSGRKLIANGYLSDENTAVMRVWDGESYDEEEVWDLFPEAVPDGAVLGSYLRLFEDSSLELYAPVWTEEEIAEIKRKEKEYDWFFDGPDDS